MENEDKKIRKFTVDNQRIVRLEKQFHSRGLDRCIYTLDSLVNYAKMRYKSLEDNLANSDLTDDSPKDYEGKIATAEREFRHILDVSELCLKRPKGYYSDEYLTVLTTVGILHDIGRIDEIMSQNKDTVFKLKVDHAELGVNYLFSGEAITKSDKIYDFIDEDLVSVYGDLIKKCIKYHSSYKVPMGEFSTALAKALIHDIRLIDKISIMNSSLVEDMSTIIGISLDELSKCHISDETYCELLTIGTIDRKKEGEPYTPIRHFLSHIGFIYDMDDITLLEDKWVDKYMDMYKPEALIDQKRKAKIIESTKHYITHNLMN